MGPGTEVVGTVVQLPVAVVFVPGQDTVFVAGIGIDLVVVASDYTEVVAQ